MNFLGHAFMAMSTIGFAKIVVGTLLISTITLLFSSVLGRHSALRHTVLFSGLIGCLAVPIVVIVVGRTGPAIEFAWLAPENSVIADVNPSDPLASIHPAILDPDVEHKVSADKVSSTRCRAQGVGGPTLGR